MKGTDGGDQADVVHLTRAPGRWGGFNCKDSAELTTKNRIKIREPRFGSVRV